MPARYTAALLLGIAAVIGWNVFCAFRDEEMFRVIDNEYAQMCRIDSSYCASK